MRDAQHKRLLAIRTKSQHIHVYDYCNYEFYVYCYPLIAI